MNYSQHFSKQAIEKQPRGNNNIFVLKNDLQQFATIRNNSLQFITIRNNSQQFAIEFQKKTHSKINSKSNIYGRKEHQQQSLNNNNNNNNNNNSNTSTKWPTDIKSLEKQVETRRQTPHLEDKPLRTTNLAKKNRQQFLALSAAFWRSKRQLTPMELAPFPGCVGSYKMEFIKSKPALRTRSSTDFILALFSISNLGENYDFIFQRLEIYECSFLILRSFAMGNK